MKKMKIMSIAVALACAALVNANAQTRNDYNSSGYILPSVNMTRPDSAFGSDNQITGFGLRFGKPISPWWDLQLGSSLLRANNDLNRYEQATLGLDGLLMFSRSNFRPFVLVGAGAQYDKVKTPAGSANATSPYVAAGVGFQYSFSERWGMQADIRRTHARISGDNFNFKRSNTDLVTLGVTYAFGGATAPAPRAEPAPTYVAPPPVAVAPPPAPPAPVPAPPPAPKFERYTLSATELFAFDSSTLKMPQAKLDEIATALTGNSQVNNVAIVGYTDRLGSDAYNLKLSQRRADSVKTYLSNKGVDSNRLTATGKGESNPVTQCSDKKMAALIECLEPNRRVEIEQIVIERRVQ